MSIGYFLLSCSDLVINCYYLYFAMRTFHSRTQILISFMCYWSCEGWNETKILILRKYWRLVVGNNHSSLFKDQMSNDISAGSYIPSPSLMKGRKSLLNIRNKDDQCFLYCIAAAYRTPKRNRIYPKYYKQMFNRFNMDGEFETTFLF